MTTLRKKIHSKAWMEIAAIQNANNFLTIEQAISDGIAKTFGLWNAGMKRIQARQQGEACLRAFERGQEFRQYCIRSWGEVARDIFMSYIPTKFRFTHMYREMASRHSSRMIASISRKQWSQIMGEKYDNTTCQDPECDYLWEKRDGTWYPVQGIGRESEEAMFHFSKLSGKEQFNVITVYALTETGYNMEQAQEFAQRCLSGDFTYADEESMDDFRFWYWMNYISKK